MPGWTAYEMSSHLGESRSTVQRRLDGLELFGLVRRDDDNRYYSTDEATAIHVSTFREFTLIALGEQDGISDDLAKWLTDINASTKPIPKGKQVNIKALQRAAFRPKLMLKE